jgi:hypothetical protein
MGALRFTLPAAFGGEKTPGTAIKRCGMQRSMALLLLFPLFLTGCGGGGNNNPADPAASTSISGNWQMTLQPANTNAAPRAQSGFLVQSGNTVSGNLLLTDPPCSGTAAVSGNVSGTSVSIGLNPVGVSVSLTGTLGTPANSMSGSYTILSTGCVADNTSPDTGTWTGSLVSPLNGSFQGQFTLGNDTASYSLAGSVTQGPNTGTLNATVAGTFTMTGYCFASANISGVVNGTSAVMNLLDSTGNQIGEMYGTTSTDGSSMNGRFSYEGEGPTGAKGCRTPQAGPVCLIWQPSGNTNCSITSDLSDPK